MPTDPVIEFNEFGDLITAILFYEGKYYLAQTSPLLFSLLHTKYIDLATNSHNIVISIKSIYYKQLSSWVVITRKSN